MSAVDAAPVVVPEAMETDAAPAADAASAKTKGRKSTGVKSAKSSPSKAKKTAGSDLHPKYSQMINEAIIHLKERHGSSRQAILKYILSTYNVLTDERQVNNHLKMSLRAGVKSGKLMQAKGSGACGSYKLGGEDKVSKKQTKSPAKKVAKLTKIKVPKTAASKVAQVAAKKAKSPKKGKTSKSPKKTSKSPPKGTKAKSPAKQKTTKTRSPAKKATKAVKKSKTPKKTTKKIETEVPETAAEQEQNDTVAEQSTTAAVETTPSATTEPAPAQVDSTHTASDAHSPPAKSPKKAARKGRKAKA